MEGKGDQRVYCISIIYFCMTFMTRQPLVSIIIIIVN